MKTLRLAVPLAGLLASCASNDSQPPAPPPSGGSATAAGSASNAPGGDPLASLSWAELGTKVVEMLRAGENAKVRALFDDAMNKAVPSDDKVAEMWAGIEAKSGKLEKVVDTAVKEKDGLRAVLVTCAFETMPMDVRVVFDEKRRIAGLFLTPTSSPKAYGLRPQHPKPPFPYDAREVSYDNDKDKTHMAGTLTLPKGAGPFPAVLLVTGSGTQDRDETLFGHKPFLVVADALTRAGIAVLRVDDPGIGGSKGDPAAGTLESHARDVQAGLAFLKTQKEIDPKRLGLVGHSEGGILAAMVAASSKEVAFVVSLAGTGLSGAEILPMQMEAILRADGKIKDAGIKELVDAQKKLVKLVGKGAKESEIDDALKASAEIALKHAPTEKDKDAVKKTAAAGLAQLKSAWFKSFIQLDPAKHWAKVTVPVLALNGDKDLQVPADPNLAAIKAALGKAKNKDATTDKLAGLNHLFQPAKSGLVEEYAKIETTFDEKALGTMTEWLKKRAGVK